MVLNKNCASGVMGLPLIAYASGEIWRKSLKCISFVYYYYYMQKEGKECPDS